LLKKEKDLFEYDIDEVLCASEVFRKKNRRERERESVIIQSQHEKNEIFFLGQLKSETIEMHHFSCFFY
jgi:hypothetical protein